MDFQVPNFGSILDFLIQLRKSKIDPKFGTLKLTTKPILELLYDQIRTFYLRLKKSLRQLNKF